MLLAFGGDDFGKNKALSTEDKFSFFSFKNADLITQRAIT